MLVISVVLGFAVFGWLKSTNRLMGSVGWAILGGVVLAAVLTVITLVRFLIHPTPTGRMTLPAPILAVVEGVAMVSECSHRHGRWSHRRPGATAYRRTPPFHAKR